MSTANTRAYFGCDLKANFYSPEGRTIPMNGSALGIIAYVQGELVIMARDPSFKVRSSLNTATLFEIGRVVSQIDPGILKNANQLLVNINFDLSQVEFIPKVDLQPHRLPSWASVAS